MKDKLRDLFTFSSGERKGILLLVLVLIVICSLKLVIINHPAVPVIYKYPDWMKDTLAVEETDHGTNSENDLFAGSFPANPENAESQKTIDPNNASMEDLILAGFSLRVSRTIIRYRESGGRFKTTGDLKKIYGLTPALFQSVESHVKINAPVSPDKPETVLPARININRADSVSLVKLPGIGPVLARRIIRYRNLLGGYYSIEQIREVYGITDSLLIKIGVRLEADTAGIKKLNLNTMEERDLARHPYLGKYVAAGIIQYRKHQGKILNLNELPENGLIGKEDFNRVKFYLSL